MRSYPYKAAGIVAAALFAVAPVAILPALSPTLVAGAYAETMPGDAPEYGLLGSLGFRFPVGEEGYTLFSAYSTLTGLRSAAESGTPPYDYSRVELTASLPAGNDRVDITGAAGAALLGAAEEERYIDPAWELRWRFERGRRKVRPFLAYAGSYRYEENGTGGYLSSGAKAGFVYSPEVEARWEFQAGGHIQSFPDQTGDDGEARQDLLLETSLSADLLPGLFWEMILEPSVGWRSSSSSAESAITAKLPLSLRWSPAREWSFQLDGSAGLTFRTEDSGTDTAVQASFRIDRTVTDSFFLYLEGGGGGDIDPWLRAGIDVSF